MLSFATLLLFSATSGSSEWSLEVIDEHTPESSDTNILEMIQYVGSHRVLGAALTVEIDSTGELVTVDANWVPLGENECDTEPTAQVLAKASETWGLRPVDLSPAVVPTANGHFSCAFYYEDDEMLFVVGSNSQVILERMKIRQYEGTNIGNLTIRRYPTATDVRYPVGLRTVNATASRESIWFTGNCRYHLAKYNTSHPLGRPNDSDGGEYEIVMPCSSTYRPIFGETNGDSVREATFYYYEERTRQLVGVPMWNYEAPQRSATTTLSLDETWPICGNASGCFSSAAQTIYLKTDAQPNLISSWDTVAHEYGHYISWTYGSSGWWCNHGIDEGDAVEEAVADISAMAVAIKEHRAPYLYPWAKVNGGVPHRSDLLDSAVMYEDRCAESIYREGDFFVQAMWEVMHDANCADGVCTATTVWGNQIFDSGDPVTRTLQALAYALDRLGPDITFAQLVNKMADGLAYTEEEPFKDIFRHHGLGV
jgi:hypothetical protein